MKQHADKTIERLMEYLTNEEGVIVLSDREEQILKLVLAAHELFQAHKFPSGKIAQMLCHQFQCSIQTASAAMRDAQIIFGTRLIYNRAYMAGAHLDEIISDINKAREKGDMELVLQLHKIKIKIIELLPAQVPIRDLTPAVINFNIIRADIKAATIPIQEALSNAYRLLNIAQPEISEDVE